MDLATAKALIEQHWIRVGMSVMAVGLLVAALLHAPLTWDGAYYLFATLDTGTPFVPHDRTFAKILHTPVVWSQEAFSSLELSTFVFSLIHVLNPLVALGLSWLVVRKRNPRLFVWPMLCIGLALLPGQINFISEGIKADQLVWPLLLAIVTGLRGYGGVVAVLVAASIWYLHPVAAPIFLATGLAAAAMAIRSSEDRWRLAPAAIALFALGAVRMQAVREGGQQSEMTWYTQQRQWDIGAGGLPTLALIGIAGLILLQLWQRRQGRIFRIAQWGLLVFVAVVMVTWAAQPTLWWEALEYRGPAFWITMIVSGLMVAHQLWQPSGGHQQEEGYRLLVIGVAVCFALVISVQSYAWNSVVRGMSRQLSSTDAACIALEDTQGYPFTPLNLWSTKSHSLLEQGESPTSILMPAWECHRAQTTGEFDLSEGRGNRIDNRVDLSAIRSSMAEATTCTWQFGDGWYQQEALIPDSWRWSGSEGTAVVTVSAGGTMHLTANIRAMNLPNDIEIRVNGELVTTITVSDSDGSDVDRLPINVIEGENLISFRSSNAPVVLPNDERPLAVSVWNLALHPGDGSSRCHWINE